MADTFPAGGYVRRARRLVGLSQREFAELAGVSASVVARLEGAADAGAPTLTTLQKLLAAAGLRLSVVDEEGRAVAPMSDDAQHDFAGRHYPAHLDVRRCERPGDWWYERFQTTWLPPPSHTFDLSRWSRDNRRARLRLSPADDDDRHRLVGQGTAERRVIEIIYAYLPGWPWP